MKNGKTFSRLAVVLLLGIFLAKQAAADVIVRDLRYTLGAVAGTFGDSQTISGVSTFFPDDTFTIGVGDTLILNILFDGRLEVFDVGEPSLENFSFALNIVPGSPGFNGRWTSSIEALGGEGDVWEGPITFGWMGGGAGFGWGGQGINIASSQGSFTGIRWTTTITTANEGSPMTIYAFTGVQMTADGIRVLPLADPAELLQALFDDVAGVGPGKSLADKVALAQTYYAVPDVQATCAVLTDFGNEVRAQRGKKIAAELADELTADAQAIMGLIGCE